MNWAQEHRHEFIRQTLNNGGVINRSMLMEKFSITPATATRDISTLAKLEPNLMYYDKSSKCFRLTPTKPQHWPDKIDAFAHHEALHMSSKLAEAVNEWLVDHPAIATNPDRLRLAEDAAATLFKLYQLIGRDSLGHR